MAITARKKLELSRLAPAADTLALHGEDVDISHLEAVISGNTAITDLDDRIVDGTVSATIEGSSTVSITINDYDRQILRSGLINRLLDVKIDGLWWRLASCDKAGDDLTLTFEDREVAVMRTYDKWRIVSRDKMTRAEFVLSLIREVKEFDIPVVIPELHKVQPIEKYAGDPVGQYNYEQNGQGIPENYNAQIISQSQSVNHREPTDRQNQKYLRVKGAIATPDQISNANIIMQVGQEMGMNRKVIVSAIMTAITESSIHAYPDKAHGGNSDADSAGIFQQRPSWGSYEDRMDPATSARLYYERAAKEDTENPNETLWQLCANVQHPRADLETAYAKWQTEAENWVSAFGLPGQSGQNYPASTQNSQTGQISGIGEFFFYRGEITDHRGNPLRKPENSWRCTQRLADEVDWRSFFAIVNNVRTYYFIDESDLFKQQASAIIHEFDDGIDSIDGNYDGHKLNAEIKLKARVGRWKVPAGSVVVFENMGPWDGRWLVTDFQRPLLKSTLAEITLKKPRPQLPEPLNESVSTNNWPATWLPATPKQPGVVPGGDHIAAVLNNPAITWGGLSHDPYKTKLERSDVQFGSIDDRLLTFMLWLVNQGYSITVSAMKSDHSENTTQGRISAHSEGRAVDMANFNIGNGETAHVMDLIALNMPKFGLSQLIGPYPLKCVAYDNGRIYTGLSAVAYYGQETLNEHKSHIHVGLPLR